MMKQENNQVTLQDIRVQVIDALKLMDKKNVQLVLEVIYKAYLPLDTENRKEGTIGVKNTECETFLIKELQYLCDSLN